MLLVGYSAVLGLLLLGLVDLYVWSRAHEADRLRRAGLAGAAAWLFGVGASALVLATQFPAVAGAPEDQKAVAMAGIIQGAMGPALLGTVGGMALTAAAAWLARKAGGPGGGPRP